MFTEIHFLREKNNISMLEDKRENYIPVLVYQFSNLYTTNRKDLFFLPWYNGCHYFFCFTLNLILLIEFFSHFVNEC